MPRISSRLDELPEQALTNVVRCLSSAPSPSDWQSYTQHEDTLAAVQLARSLSSIARISFQTVTVSKPNARSREEALLHLPGHFSDLLLWIRAPAESMTFLELRRVRQAPNSGEFEAVLQLVKERCIGLRNLDISELPGCLFTLGLLCALEGKLHNLFANSFQVPVITDTCRGLRHLTLTSTPSDIRDLLQVVGPAPRSLEIRVRRGPRIPSMLLVQTFCSQLTRIDFRDIHDPPDCAACANLLGSYGNQLLFAYMGNLSANQCAKVASACPNMLCGLKVYFSAAEEKLTALGPSVQNLCLMEHVAESVDPLGTELSKAAEACCNIETIELNVSAELAVHSIKQLVCEHMPKLASLRLSLDDPGSNDNAVGELSQLTRFLIYFNLRAYPESISSFKQFGHPDSLLKPWTCVYLASLSVKPENKKHSCAILLGRSWLAQNCEGRQYPYPTGNGTSPDCTQSLIYALACSTRQAMDCLWIFLVLSSTFDYHIVL